MKFIGRAAKISESIPEFKFRAMLFGRDAFYIEGARPISMTDGEMIFRANGRTVTLTGESLAVKEVSDDCVSVVGKITAFTVKDR